MESNDLRLPKHEKSRCFCANAFYQTLNLRTRLPNTRLRTILFYIAKYVKRNCGNLMDIKEIVQLKRKQSQIQVSI